jgi:hypothetical protein
MNTLSEEFYSARTSEAADNLVGTKAYQNLMSIALRDEEKLQDTLSDTQKKLYLKSEASSGEVESLVDEWLYRAGLLDGIALGLTFAAHQDERSYEQC